MEELRIERQKGYSMDHYGTETRELASHFKVAGRHTHLPFDVAHHLSVFVFFLVGISILTFRFSILRNTALAY